MSPKLRVDCVTEKCFKHMVGYLYLGSIPCVTDCGKVSYKSRVACHVRSVILYTYTCTSIDFTFLIFFLREPTQV